ncbi:MAG: sodium/proton-translocating pyrophosphatase [Marinilabiliales bacterium]|nr:sodium/proton-translocating pyrophosphatase [Marinilabiliales bacterium]
MGAYDLSLFNPLLIAGIFIGAMMAFLFSAMSMKAVGRAAGSMVDEVRRQFREIPGIMEGTGKPDYARCVAISTKGAQQRDDASVASRNSCSACNRTHPGCSGCCGSA